MSTAPAMGAEAGFEPDAELTPIRFSGFVSLALGLLSALCVLGLPLLVIPGLAILLGLIALRPAVGARPIGTTPAKFGLVLATAFGACGVGLPMFKAAELGDQAKYFARQYIELIALGHEEYALELEKAHFDRHLSALPLRQHYRSDEWAADALSKFRDDEVVQLIREAGEDADWALESRPRVYNFYGRDQVELIWIDRAGIVAEPIRLVMEYRVSQKTGDGQWNVESCEVFRDQKFVEAT